MLTIALLGEQTAINQGSGTVSDEVIAAKKGAWVELANRNLATTGFVLTNSAGTTSLLACTASTAVLSV